MRCAAYWYARPGPQIPGAKAKKSWYSSQLSSRNFQMLRFFFWNIQKQPLEEEVAKVVVERHIDFILLAECTDPAHVLRRLHQAGLKNFNYHVNPTQAAVEIFSQLSLDRVIPLGDHSGLTFRRVLPVIGQEVLLVGAHLPSKLHMSESNHMMLCTRIASRIQEYESLVGHSRTLLVGDLNMNPFEVGLVAANGLHAASSRVVAKKNARTVQGESFRLFYNPMWSHLGDNNGRPAGTYYHDRSQFVEYFWHTLDQVLVRPDLVDEFAANELEIITRIGDRTLLDDRGRPDRKQFSDHLPISFLLNPLVEVL